ncbi:MAG: glycosyltransferase family 2 protein [Candidatus Bathyarchaeota archaeon]|jgi:dolichol-phosphate mannosyltransferase|nr:glycosyltransferase family 2 protein [Candidatus Bathyarchaeota archaeon]
MWEKARDKQVLAIVAALNEEQGIRRTIAELRQHLGKPWVLVVDGNSCDRTVRIAKDEFADVIFQQGRGKGDAIAEAIKYARTFVGDVDYAVFTDADYTYPAEFLPEMIGILDENPQIGMVCGNRFNSHFHLKSMRNMFYFGNRLLAFTHNMLNGVQMRDPLTGLRVVRWDILKNWTPLSQGFDIEVELNHHVERCGYGIAEIPISYRPRLGEKKLKMKHGITIFRRILTESAR